MKNIFTIISLVFTFLLCSNCVKAQEKKAVPTISEISYAQKLGTVVPTLTKVGEREKLKPRADRSDYKAPKNFPGRFPRRIVDHSKQSKKPDALRQLDGKGRGNGELETIVNKEGLPTEGSPSDPTGDVGINYYVQAINGTEVGIFDKTGEFVSGFMMEELWQEFNRTSGGDPIVLFDQEAERWILTEFPFFANELLVAISETSDPMGAYTSYRFGTDVFPDYPKYSVWGDELAITINGGNPAELRVLFINKEDLLGAADQVRIISTQVDGPTNSEQGFIVATPVDWSGANRPPDNRGPIALSLADASWTFGQDEDMINLHSFDVNWDLEVAQSFLTQIPVSDYNSFACAVTGPRFECIPQLGNGGALDGLPEIIPFQPHYRNLGSEEAIVFNFITDAGDGNGNIRAGIRWIELRRNAVDDWRLHQEGTYAPDDGLHRFIGSIAMDANGNIGLAYCTSSATEFVGIRYTGRNNGDPLGVMTFDEAIAVEGTNTVASPFGRSRFGDYAHMTIDPVDQRTFWFTSEYAANNSSTSRILAFQTERPEFDLSPTLVVTPQNSSDLSDSEVLEVEIKNLGAQDITEAFQIGYQLEDGPIISEEINTPILSDQTLRHSFAETLDLAEIGVYNLKVFTSAQLDEILLNDTLSTVIIKYPELDAAVSRIGTPSTGICGTEGTIDFRLDNLGTVNLTSVNVEILLNGTQVDAFVHTTNLDFQSNEIITRDIEGFIDGDNQVEIRVQNPNNSSDQVADNNIAVGTLGAMTSGVTVTLDLLPDFYVNETSWALIDMNGNTIAEVEDIPTELAETHILTDFCLEENTCYTYFIQDAAFDGLTSFDQEDGNYEILDAEGNILVSILEFDFGGLETNMFCTDGDPCQLHVSVTTLDATDMSNGSMLIEIEGGRGTEFSYSLDGVAFQDENLFFELPAGNYDLHVRDMHGCEIIESVTIGGSTSVEQLDENVTAKIYPNPTDGLFSIELTGYNSQSSYFDVFVYDASGKTIQKSAISKFGDDYRGMVTLHNHSAGNYFIKLQLDDDSHLMQVKKI